MLQICCGIQRMRCKSSIFRTAFSQQIANSLSKLFIEVDLHDDHLRLHGMLSQRLRKPEVTIRLLSVRRDFCKKMFELSSFERLQGSLSVKDC